MKKQNKIILGIGILAIMFLVYQFGKAFAPGSYPYAEMYEINAPEKEVIKAIEQFKTSHSNYIVPNVTINNNGSFSMSESEGRKENSYWYLNYFYFQKENQIVFTWTRPSGKNKTDLALVSINQGLDLGKWKDVNNDFDYSENKEIKTKFEKRILIPIKHLLKVK